MGLVYRASVWSVLLVYAFQVEAQIYRASFKEHKVQILSSFALWSGAQLYDVLRPGEMLDEYRDVDPSYLWTFDRRIIGKNSILADGWSDGMLFASIASPFVLTALDHTLKEDVSSIIWMGLQGYFIESGVTQLVKILSERPRPYIYSQGEHVLNQLISKNSTKSFFSGHASSSAYFAFFTAKVYCDTHPDSPWKPVIWTMAAGISGTTAYLRTRAGKHFYSDVAAGWLFGATLGILIPELYKGDRVALSVQGNNMSLQVKL